MKRIVVFLIVGPLLVAAASFFLTRPPRPPRSEWLLTSDLFLSTATASIIVGLVDGYLARTSALFPRVLLTAAVGAIVAWPLANALVFKGIAGFLLSTFFLKDLTPALFAAFALPGAVYAGVCSLLANGWAGGR
jgi:hypothetical protein